MTERIQRRDVLKLAGAAMVGIGGAALAGTPALAATGGGPVGIAFFELAAEGIATAPFRSLIELRMAVERPAQRSANPPFVAVIEMANRPAADVYAWFAAAASGKKSGKRAAHITAFDQQAHPVLRWDLVSASPSEIKSNSSTTELLTQVTLIAGSIAPA